ncbi:MAG: hypothetical protein ACO1TE_11230 [Prosthecobacter sp.]
MKRHPQCAGRVPFCFTALLAFGPLQAEVRQFTDTNGRVLRGELAVF